MLEQGSRQRRGNYVTSTLGRGIRRNSQVEVEGQIRIDGEDGSGEVRGQGGEGVRSGDGGLWAIAGTARRRRARLIRMVTPGGWHRGVAGTLFCSVDARRPLRTQWLSPLCMLLILTLRTRPPRQGYATVTSVCCLRLNQVSNLPMRDLCVGCSVRGPGVVRRVGGLCPGGVRCGVSL